MTTETTTIDNAAGEGERSGSMVEQQIQEMEQQARDLGWVPQAEFKGDPDKWVDAATYVERGQQLLPLVQATNRRLKGDLTTLQSKYSEVETQLASTREEMQALQEYHAQELKDKLARERARLTAELREARREENVEREVEIQDELTQIRTTEAGLPKPGENKTNGARPNGQDHNKAVTDPEFVAWREDNQWFGSDMARTAIADQVGRQLRASGDKSIGRAFLDKVSEGVTRELARLGAGGRPSTTSRVEGSQGGGSGAAVSRGASRGYAEMPSDARAACDKFASDPRLVGPTRQCKTVADFRKQYAQKFWEGEE